MMQLIDTHVHLHWSSFDADRDAVIARAEDAGVVAIVTLATDLASSHRAIELAGRYPIVYAGVGIHPTDVAKATPEQLQEVAELSRHPKVVAIGEIGMDFYWDTSTAALQERFFRAQLEFAAETDLPVVIHNRRAGEAIWSVLEQVPELSLRGVFHCFSEDVSYAQRVLERGFHISFAGNLTYKKNAPVDAARAIPLERLLLETDSPFIPPVPFRGRRNEPAHVKLIAEKHAQIRALPVETVCQVTTDNACRLFALRPAAFKAL